MSTEIEVITGFEQGFSKEVAAILEVADRGLLYPREIRENLAKAGMIIYEEIPLPDVEPPRVEDIPHTVNPDEFVDSDDDNEETY